VAPRIFVAIAAYRDPELCPTVRDLFAKAARPDRIDVGVCYQAAPGDDAELLGPVPYPRQVHLARFAAADAKGSQWAKSVAMCLRRSERFTLLCDSHMRFAPGWDAAMIDELARCHSARPVLSTHPAPYHPATPESGERLEYATPVLDAGAAFSPEGVLPLAAHICALTAPARGAFAAGGFIFASSRLFDEVPLDPKLFFAGEECAYSARIFTAGWDVFAPGACLIHHFYGRSKAAKVWSDNRDWSTHNARSIARIKHLLGTAPSGDPDVTDGLDRYGLGRVRTLAQFEAFARVDFRARTVTARATRGECGA
jgi:hypothetical protein